MDDVFSENLISEEHIRHEVDQLRSELEKAAVTTPTSSSG